MKLKLRTKFCCIPGAEDLVMQNQAGPDGYNEVIVYKSFVPKIMALVETDKEALRFAQETYEGKRLAYIFGDEQPIADPERWGKHHKERAQMFPESIESVFQGLRRRGINPIEEAYIVEDDLPPPLSLEMQHAKLAMAAPQTNAADVSAQLAEMMRKIEALEVANASLKSQLRRG